MWFTVCDRKISISYCPEIYPIFVTQIKRIFDIILIKLYLKSMKFQPFFQPKTFFPFLSFFSGLPSFFLGVPGSPYM